MFFFCETSPPVAQSNLHKTLLMWGTSGWELKKFRIKLTYTFKPTISNWHIFQWFLTKLSFMPKSALLSRSFRTTSVWPYSTARWSDVLPSCRVNKTVLKTWLTACCLKNLIFFLYRDRHCHLRSTNALFIVLICLSMASYYYPSIIFGLSNPSGRRSTKIMWGAL